MPLRNQARSEALWQEARRAAEGEIDDMIEAVAGVLRDALRDRVQELRDAVNGKATAAHTHQPSDVTGLVAQFNTLQTRLTAAEARLTALEAKVP